MKKTFFSLLFLGSFITARSQSLSAFADSIRRMYHIPELGYAVVSADTVYELNVSGVTKINTDHKARLTDKFRIGSNTKAITGLLVAQLVKQGKISWDTRFFDLYPELKASSRPEHYNVTLQDLLTFRTHLYAYTYTNEEPKKEQFTGDEAKQRYQFTKWFLQQPPIGKKGAIRFSNLGYIMAGLMMEKAGGKPYKQMVKDLGGTLGIDFGFGQPNNMDTLQPWGHNGDLEPEAPGDNYKLDWLLPAGNINVSLPDYAKFIRLQLLGLQGRSSMLDSNEFKFMHYGLPEFAVGWFWERDGRGRVYSYNTGNPGSFLTMVYVFKDTDRGYIIFSNAQTDEATKGMSILLSEMEKTYNK